MTAAAIRIFKITPTPEGSSSELVAMAVLSKRDEVDLACAAKNATMEEYGLPQRFRFAIQNTIPVFGENDKVVL